MLGALEHGEAITPAVAGRWSCDDMLNLAGLALFVAARVIPPELREGEILPMEHQEARGLTAAQDCMESAVFIAGLVRAVRDGDYDQNFEEILGAVVRGGSGDESGKVLILTGQRRGG